jgi:serine/threonine protein kinase
MEEGSPYTIEKGLFMVLEYVEGGSLWDLVTRQLTTKKNLYSTKEAVRLLIGVAKGLQFLHERQPTVGGWVA